MFQKITKKKLRNKEILVKKATARMSALGTALLCTFIEKAFKGLKGLVVFWRSSLLKGKIVALQFFVLLLFTDLKRLLKPERRLLWCKDHCFKNAEFYFWKEMLRSRIAFILGPRIQTNTSQFRHFYELENTYDCIIELLYKPFIVIFHCKSTSNKDQSGSTTFTITAKCTSFSSSPSTSSTLNSVFPICTVKG